MQKNEPRTVQLGLPFPPEEEEEKAEFLTYGEFLAVSPVMGDSGLRGLQVDPQPDSTPVLELGQVSYQRYGAAVYWKTDNGKEMPEWAELPLKVRAGWAAVERPFAEAMLGATMQDSITTLSHMMQKTIGYNYAQSPIEVAGEGSDPNVPEL